MRYTPPTPEQLRTLKATLQYTGKQMAELFGLAGDQQWRKYTGGQAPREMNAQMLFYAAAQLELTSDQIASVLHRMREFGAHITLQAD